MDDRQAFKLAFLQKCADDGLDEAEMAERIQKAAGVLDRVLGAGGWLASQSPWLLAGTAAGGFGLGALGAEMSVPSADDANDIKTRELTDEYRRMVEQLRLASQSAQRRKGVTRGGRPLI